MNGDSVFAVPAWVAWVSIGAAVVGVYAVAYFALSVAEWIWRRIK